MFLWFTKKVKVKFLLLYENFYFYFYFLKNLYYFIFLKKYKSTKIFKSTKVFVRKMLQKKLFFPNNHFQHTHKFCVDPFLKKDAKIIEKYVEIL